MTRRTEGLIGVLAAALALGTTELVAGLAPGGRSPFVAVGEAVISLTPGPVVRFAIDTFGSRNRLVLLGSMALGIVVAAWLLGRAAGRRPSVGVGGIVAFGVAGALAAISDPLLPMPAAILAPTVGAVAGAATLLVLLRVAPRPDTPSPAGTVGIIDRSSDPTWVEEPVRSRRAFLGLAGSALATAAVFAVAGRALQERAVGEGARLATRLRPAARPLPAPSTAAMLDVPGVSPVLTPTADFYRIDTAFTVPRIDPAAHRLRITGMVEAPFELTFDELLELADTEHDVTLSCVSNEVGGRLVGTARWQGVPLERLLDRAGVQPGATQLVGRSVDGWTGGFPVEAATDGRPALVAVGMNGAPLPARHGFPARLVVAGLYGYVSDTKWLSEIELTTFEAHEGYWIPRGWARHGPIKTQSRIDVPSADSAVAAGTVAVAGVAWSDELGVSGVEVSVDGGPWTTADLSEELSTSSWRQWHLPWDATPGGHTLSVRAFDADGVPQTADVSPPAPDGATGHHTIEVSVT